MRSETNIFMVNEETKSCINAKIYFILLLLLYYKPLLLIALDNHYQAHDSSEVFPVPLSHIHKYIRLLMHIVSIIRYVTILMTHAAQQIIAPMPMQLLKNMIQQ